MYLAICNGDGHYKRAIEVYDSQRDKVEDSVGDGIDEIVLVKSWRLYPGDWDESIESEVIDVWMTKSWLDKCNDKYNGSLQHGK